MTTATHIASAAAILAVGILFALATVHAQPAPPRPALAWMAQSTSSTDIGAADSLEGAE